ncbi:D-serine ammonia-lyase [Tatumella sp. TA1]|nr:D-serine ammonia-lyase [Tatumella sp. TA1]
MTAKFAQLHRLEIVQQLAAQTPVLWNNPQQLPVSEGLIQVGLTLEDVQDAAARLQRFAPLIAEAFPESRSRGGIIESEVVALPAMQQALMQQGPLAGKLWLKKDSHLPISGSIKARGGIYEVLVLAEKLALDAGLIREQDDYRRLLAPQCCEFFGRYKIAVGSTGNLGLSIGIVGATLGFQVIVHMSADAREWKKQRLRDHQVTVVEHEDDYSVAVEQGRQTAADDPYCFFIDDEHSHTLFLGYAVAGLRLPEQLAALDINVDREHPLYVYLPCGVGGGPGGVAFGLKLAFGDAVHCFFAEPTHSPCMLLGMSTGYHDAISVQDIGLDNQTIADGLAVGRASGFVGRAMQSLIDGCYTLSDQRLADLQLLLHRTENIQLEPSALAGMQGPLWVCSEPTLQLEKATHLVWATGGSMVPEEEMQRYLAMGKPQ